MNLPVLAILTLFALAVVVFALVKSGRRESTPGLQSFAAVTAKGSRARRRSFMRETGSVRTQRHARLSRVSS